MTFIIIYSKTSPTESKSRADNLLVSINPETREIQITVIEIKCRKTIGTAEADDLRLKMRDQMENTILALRMHFDPEYHRSFDRLDREIKNKEFKSLLSFYIERAYRYEYLNENAHASYSTFLQTLNAGFKLSFKQLGLIFDFSATRKHHKESVYDDLTFFTFGGNLIEQILDPNSDLNTSRLEDRELENDLEKAIGMNGQLRPFITQLTAKEQEPEEPALPIIPQEPLSDQCDIDSIEAQPTIRSVIETGSPKYDILVGKNSVSDQYGILGESVHGRKIAIDLSETNTISLFCVQGGGKKLHHRNNIRDGIETDQSCEQTPLSVGRYHFPL